MKILLFIKNLLIFIKSPYLIKSYISYWVSRYKYGHGVAKIQHNTSIRVSSFSEYLSVYNLMPSSAEINLLRIYTEKAKIVFDIGANVGTWSITIAKNNKNICVYSFEPNPITFEHLRHNIRDNNLSNIEPVNAAASDKDGIAQLQVPQSASMFGRVLPDNVKFQKQGRYANSNNSIYDIKTISLDKYCVRNNINFIDFIKIDVEGYEYSVVVGLHDMLKQKKIYSLYIETDIKNHTDMGRSFDMFTKYMLDMGYQFYTIMPDGSHGKIVNPAESNIGNHLCLPA